MTNRLGTKLPRFSTYGNYSNSNYGAHALVFEDVMGNEYYFSYKTLVAFRHYNHALAVLQNYWSTTTGKHLNAIDGGDKKNRVTKEQFEHIFREQFGVELKAVA